MPELISSTQARTIQKSILSGAESICTKFCQSTFLNYHEKSSDSKINCEYLAGSILGNQYVFAFSTLEVKPESIRITSHSGSPYGGVCLDNSDPSLLKTIYEEIFEWFRKEYDANLSFEIRLPPSILHDGVAAHEWALWSLGFQTEVIYLGRYFNGRSSNSFNRNRKRRIAKLDRESFRFENFSIPTLTGYEILKSNRVGRHSVAPLHTLKDFELIEAESPGTIETCLISHEDYSCAVAIVFQDCHFSTLQYLAGSECSFDCGSQDLLMQNLIEESYKTERFLLLGTSTNPDVNHRELNHGLDLYKESFGAKTYSAHRLVLSKELGLSKTH